MMPLHHLESYPILKDRTFAASRKPLTLNGVEVLRHRVISHALTIGYRCFSRLELALP